VNEQHTLAPRQAARYLGISEAALRLWRSRAEGPRYFKAGEKLIRYRRADLDSWIEARLCEPGSGSKTTAVSQE
jgi:predicted DNA-binding transcriptional regulator AlpA